MTDTQKVLEAEKAAKVLKDTEVFVQTNEDLDVEAAKPTVQ